MKTKLNRLLKRILLGLILAGVLFQFGTYLITKAPQLADVRKNFGQPHTWRSGIYFVGSRFGEFMVFLNETIPLDATVVTPSAAMGNPYIANPNLIQFYLHPRKIVNCTENDKRCLAGFSEKDAYLVILEPAIFPGSENKDLLERITFMDNKWGVLLPEEPGDPPPPIEGYLRFEDILLDALLPAAWMILLAFSGGVVMLRLRPEWGPLSALIIGALPAMGLYSLLMAFILAVGVNLTEILVWGLAAIFTLLALSILVTGRKEIGAHLRIDPRKRSISSLWPALFLILTAVATILSVGKGYHATDSLGIWGIKGYAIQSEGLFSGTSQWGAAAAFYPLNIPILIGAMKAAFSEALPASKLLFPLYFAGLIFTAYEFIRSRLKSWQAGLIATLIATAPLVTIHAEIAYANLPLTATLVLAVTFTLENRERSSGFGSLLFSGVLLALTAWVRPEGLYIAVAFLAVLLALDLSRDGWPSLKRSWSIGLPFLIYWVAWSAVARKIYQDSNKLFYSKDLINSFQEGDIHIEEAWFILKSLPDLILEPVTWGAVGIVLLAALLFSLVKWNWEETEGMMLLTGVLILLMTSGIVFLISFTGQAGCGLECWVYTGLNRYIIPGVILILLATVRNILSEIEEAPTIDET